MIEHELISSILKFKEFDFGSGFSKNLLEDPDCIKAYRFLDKHYTKYRKFPSLKTFQDEFEDFGIKKNVKEPPDYYMRKVHEKWLVNQMQKSTDEAGKLILDDDINGAFDHLQNSMSRMSTYSLDTTDENIVDNVKERYEDYKINEELKGMLGIPFPWDTLNDITGGLKDGGLYIVSGKRKQGKTWVVSKIAFHAHRNLNCDILFVSPEMTTKEIKQRYDILNNEFGQSAFVRGMLSKKEKKKYKHSLKDLSKLKNKFIISDTVDTAGNMNIRYVEGKILKYRPQLTIIDGTYLFMDEFNTKDRVQRMYNLSRYCKVMAKQHKIPIIIVIQMKRGKDKKDIEDVAWGDSFAQDCDCMIMATPNPKIRKSEIEVLGIREGEAGGIFDISWDFSEVTLDECEKIEVDDKSDDEYNGTDEDY